MINIVIADDEKLIRAGIKKILMDNLGSDIEIYEAKNGRESLELCAKLQPYVVITDIRMPGMDGVEFMNEISTWPEKPAIIVLSGFDDFTYAKAAINNGALAYILKPVDTKELMTAVNKALSSVKKEEKEKKEQNLRSIISDGYTKTGGFDFKSDFYCVTVTGEFEKTPEELFENISPSYIFERRKEFFSVLVTRNGIDDIEDDENFKDCVVGISMASSNINELRKISSQAYSATLLSFFQKDNGLKENGIYKFTYENNVTDFTDIDRLYEKMIAQVDLVDSEELKKSISVLLDFSSYNQNLCGEILHYIYDKIVNNLFKRYPKFHDTDTYLYLKSLMIENIHQTKSLNEWKSYVTDYVIYLTELLHKQQGKYPYITKAVAYISQHFAEDITMATVANEVSMNYTWFSEKFKEQVGVNFNDYLKKYRMEQAKKFLEMGIYKVYEVAEKSGFNDVKHFMKSFREMNGMSAGEWARTHVN